MRLGTDLVSVTRLAGLVDRHGQRFRDRILTQREQAICGQDVRRLAGRFAGKEAVSKALGTGIGRLGIGFRDIEIDCDPLGAPFVRLHGAARLRFEALGGQDLVISLSHEEEMALAFCVLTLQGKGDKAHG